MWSTNSSIRSGEQVGKSIVMLQFIRARDVHEPKFLSQMLVKDCEVLEKTG